MDETEPMLKHLNTNRSVVFLPKSNFGGILIFSIIFKDTKKELKQFEARVLRNPITIFSPNSHYFEIHPGLKITPKYSIKDQFKRSKDLFQGYYNCHLPRNSKFNYHLTLEDLSLMTIT